jgi:fimbrial chaperone protein
MTDSQMSGTVVITNPSSTHKAVEIIAKKRSHTLDGQEIHEDTEEFVIIPPQVIVGPKQERAVAIQWIGDRNLTKELPYRIIVDEVPIKNKKNDDQAKAGNVTIKLQFINSLYIRPKGTQSNIELLTASTQNDTMDITLKNSGTQHQIIKEMELNFSDQTTSPNPFVISNTMIEGGLNILPNETRKITIKKPDSFSKNTQLNATLSFK